MLCLLTFLCLSLCDASIHTYLYPWQIILFWHSEDVPSMAPIHPILPWAGTASHCITPVPLSQTVPTMPYRKGVRLASRRLSSLGNSLVVVRQPESYLCQCFLGDDTLFLLWLHQYLKDTLKSRSLWMGLPKNSVVYTLQWPQWCSEALFPLSFHNDATVNISPCAESFSPTNSEH